MEGQDEVELDINMRQMVHGNRSTPWTIMDPQRQFGLVARARVCFHKMLPPTAWPATTINMSKLPLADEEWDVATVAVLPPGGVLPSAGALLEVIGERAFSSPLILVCPERAACLVYSLMVTTGAHAAVGDVSLMLTADGAVEILQEDKLAQKATIVKVAETAGAAKRRPLHAALEQRALQRTQAEAARRTIITSSAVADIGAAVARVEACMDEQQKSAASTRRWTLFGAICAAVGLPLAAVVVVLAILQYTK